METIQFLAAVVALITSTGLGAVVTYFWQRAKRKWESKTLEGRVEVANSLGNLPAKDHIGSFQDRAQYAYSYTAYVAAISDLARQIHAISKIRAYVMAGFFYFSGVIVALVSSLLGTQAFNRGETSVGTRWYVGAAAFTLVTFFAGVDTVNQRETSLSGLVSHLLRAKDAVTINSIVEDAMSGCTFSRRMKKFPLRWETIPYSESNNRLLTRDKI